MGSPARTGRASRADARALVLDRLSDAMERLFASGSTYAGLTVEAIAAEAGISKSTFYFHFEDKGALLAETLRNVQDEFLDTADRWLAADFGMSFDELGVRLGNVVAAYRRHRLLLAAVVDASARDVVVREAYFGSIHHFEHAAATHLRGGHEAGLLSAEVDPERTAAWLVWMLERGLHQLVRPAPAEDVEVVADTLTRLVWRAVYARPAAG